MKNTLSAQYPSLYCYHTRKQIDWLFADAAKKIDEHTTNLQFFTEIKFLLSSLKDGHLSASASPVLGKYLKGEALFFPLRLYFEHDKVFLASPLSEKYPVGAQLLSINGRKISAIRNELFKYIVGDGNITSKKIVILDHVFHLYYLLAYGEQPQFQVLLKAPDGTLAKKTFRAVRETGLPALSEPPDERKLLQFKITGDHVGLLRIKSFDRSALSAQGFDFPLFVQSAFDELRKNKIGRLIIDLQDNSGGTDLYGALVYRYLASSPFRYYQQLSTVTDQLPYQQLSAGVSSFNNLSPALLTKTTDGFILKQRAHVNLSMQQPASNCYSGKVVFLINGLTFSTAAELCAIARANNRGLFVGQETGGAFNGNTSGVQVEFTLPYSGITVSYGLIQYRMAVKQKHKGRGILPDYVLSPSWQDMITHKETELDFAFGLLH